MRKSKLDIWNLPILAVIVLMEIFFFQKIIFSDAMLGSSMDCRLNVFFCEHWYRFFQGKEAINDMCNMFYPEKNVLAYSDIMLGFGCIYSILRVFGCNMILALKVVLIGTHFLGSFTLYYYLRSCLKTKRIPALIGVAFFSFSSLFYHNVTNVQLFAISFLPLVLLFLHLWAKNIDSPKRHIFLSLAAFLLVMLIYTAFYVAFYAGLFVGMFLVTYCVVHLILEKKEWVKKILLHIKNNWLGIIFYVVICGLSLVPALILYLPALDFSGGRVWEEVIVTVPLFVDVIGIHKNPMYIGFTLFETIILAILLVAYFATKQNKKQKSEVVILTLVMIEGLLLCSLFGTFTLWKYIFYHVPGGSVIRAIFRFWQVARLFNGILLAVLVDTIFKKPWTCICGIGILAGVFLTNLNLEKMEVAWNIQENTDWIEQVSEPPEDCEIMYVDFREDRFIESQLDSCEIALKYNLFTMNGYSGLEPKDWPLSQRTGTKHERAKQWVELKNIDADKVYCYDLDENTWIKYTDIMEEKEKDE